MLAATPSDRSVKRSFLSLRPRQESHFLQQPQRFQAGVVLGPDLGTSARSSTHPSRVTFTRGLCVYPRERTSRGCPSRRATTSSESCPGPCGRRSACPCSASTSSSTTKRANTPSSTSTHSPVGAAPPSAASACVSVNSPPVPRLRGRPRVLQRPPEPHQRRAPEPQPRAGAGGHRGVRRRRRQPLDRGGRRGLEEPASETLLQLGHVPQLPAALCLHDSDQGVVPVTDPPSRTRLNKEQTAAVTIILNNDHNNYDVNDDNISNQTYIVIENDGDWV